MCKATEEEIDTFRREKMPCTHMYVCMCACVYMYGYRCMCVCTYMCRCVFTPLDNPEHPYIPCTFPIFHCVVLTCLIVCFLPSCPFSSLFYLSFSPITLPSPPHHHEECSPWKNRFLVLVFFEIGIFERTRTAIPQDIFGLFLFVTSSL